LLCHGTVCVVGKIRDLILQLSKSSIYSTKPTQNVSYEKRKAKQQRLNDAVEKLNALGIVTMLVNRVHSKIVIGDEGLLCIGSFNWFSATRDEKYKRYDTSMVYRGESLQAEIKTIYSSLEQRKL
ncbi:hypothetical protein M2S66_28005, partial [Klebsiella pneumoniae]|nr:hypothetical protein [Klebsiella pneumoniae]MDZ0745246.1 hypothetical protein [Klebsiella pneumoniae]